MCYGERGKTLKKHLNPEIGIVHSIELCSPSTEREREGNEGGGKEREKEREREGKEGGEKEREREKEREEYGVSPGKGEVCKIKYINEFRYCYNNWLLYYLFYVHLIKLV